MKHKNAALLKSLSAPSEQCECIAAVCTTRAGLINVRAQNDRMLDSTQLHSTCGICVCLWCGPSHWEHTEAEVWDVRKIFKGKTLKIWIRWIKLKNCYLQGQLFCLLLWQPNSHPKWSFSWTTFFNSAGGWHCKSIVFLFETFAINWKTHLNSECKRWRQS